MVLWRNWLAQQMKGSDLNRWIAKAVSNGEFTKIREVVVSE